MLASLMIPIATAVSTGPNRRIAESFEGISDALSRSPRPDEIIALLLGICCLVTILYLAKVVAGRTPGEQPPPDFLREMLRQLNLNWFERVYLRRILTRSAVAEPGGLLMSPQGLSELVRQLHDEPDARDIRTFVGKVCQKLFDEPLPNVRVEIPSPRRSRGGNGDR